jgi:transposase-like protein
MISASWLEHWEQITPFLAYGPEVRRVIYTTNSIGCRSSGGSWAPGRSA